SFNHNSNYAIYGKDFSVGVSMVGCHAHANDSIFLENCSGFRFIGGEIRYTDIKLDGGGLNSFKDNLVENVNVSHAENGNKDMTEFNNNTPANIETDVSGFLNTPNYLIERYKTTKQSGINSETNIIYNTNRTQHLFGQANSVLYDSATGVGTIFQRGIYNINANVAVENTTSSSVDVELAIYRNDSRIQRHTYSIGSGSVQLIDISTIKIFDKDDTWKITIRSSNGSVDVLSASEAHLLAYKLN
ncbi:hypothetical protein, partial [Gracilibacillus dipsosauri]|uniref:hypothetical protein n=1 Tax=Gracilibacillus dipsosauri TaxID=178340 RepID=UPI00240937BF